MTRKRIQVWGEYPGLEGQSIPPPATVCRGSARKMEPTAEFAFLPRRGHKRPRAASCYLGGKGPKFRKQVPGWAGIRELRFCFALPGSWAAGEWRFHLCSWGVSCGFRVWI